MTQEEKVKLIATGLMGWKRHPAREFVPAYWERPERGKGGYEMRPTWNPYTSWNDCGMVKFRIVELGSSYLVHYDLQGKKWVADIGTKKGVYYGDSVMNEREAICEAVVAMLTESKE